MKDAERLRKMTSIDHVSPWDRGRILVENLVTMVKSLSSANEIIPVNFLVLVRIRMSHLPRLIRTMLAIKTRGSEFEL